jgi:hypothetical protein
VALGRRKTAGSPIDVLDLVLPGQPVSPGHQVLHEGVRAVLRAAAHRHITAVMELVDVVLHAPVPARLADQVRAHFASDDLVRAMAAHDHRFAIEVHEHALAHGVEAAVGAAQADAGGDHQVLEGVGLIGDAPRMADRRGVAGGADHDLGALVGALARHLREHAIVADDQRQLSAARPGDYRNAHVARLPGLHRHPRVHLAVVQRQPALVVDDQAAVVRIAQRVVLHDREAAPYLVLDKGGAKGRHLRAIEPAHQLSVEAHRQPMQRVLENTMCPWTESCAAPCHHLDDPPGLARQVRRVWTTGSCDCTSPITSPWGDLFNPPSPDIVSSVQSPPLTA